MFDRNAMCLWVAGSCIAFLLGMAGAHAATVDRYGRPLVDAHGTPHWYDARSATPLRAGDTWTAFAGRRDPSPSPQLTPARSLRPHSGSGANFGFAPFMAYPVGSWPDSVAIFDVNGDGRNDVVLTTTFYFDTANDYHVFVFLQAADGSLNAPISVPYPDHANSTGLAVMRVGRAAIGQSSLTSEIIVGSDAGITRFLVKRGTIGSGLFLLGQNSSTLAVIDANLDHVNDIVALSWDQDAEIFSGDGSGGFATPLPLVSNNSGWNSMVARDFDNDGRSDLLIASGQGVGAQSINVHWQSGDGHLGPPTSFGPPQDHIWYAGAGDINGDGRADIVASRAYNSPTWLWYFKGQPGRTFAPAMALPSYDIPETVIVEDVNGDGLDDIVTLHGGWQEAGVYLQASDGGMGAEQLYDLPYASQYGSTGLALGDINSDGCTDAAIADYNNGLVVMYGHDCADAAKQSAQ